MHNPCSSPYFKAESHQMKLALSFQSQTLLVFLPARKGKPFHTLSLIQNSRHLSSLVLKGKAVQGVDREDHDSVQRHSLLWSSRPPCSRDSPHTLPISRGIDGSNFVHMVHVYGTVGQKVQNNKVKTMGLPSHGPICFHLFGCHTISNTVTSQQKHDGPRVTQEAYENGLVGTYQEREGKKGWRKGAVEEERPCRNFRCSATLS